MDAIMSPSFAEESRLDQAWQMLRAAAPALPRAETLTDLLAEADQAQERGYFLPGEDEHLRQVFACYLAVRASLWEVVLSLRPLLKGGERFEVFGVAFCAAAMLLRSATFVIGLSKNRPVVWKKLDEAEERYGLERKMFTRIYRNVSSLRWMWRYQDSLKYYETYRISIHQALRERGMDEVVDWLIEEEPFFEKARREVLKRRMAYRWYSFCRRHLSGYKKVMFQIFRLGGSAIAEMKQPGRAKVGKRVSHEVKERMGHYLKAGDVLLTRHDDAMSNLFLPGFWPHAALYLGEGDFLEAKKDGVKRRALEETLSVDAFLVMRPCLPETVVKEALSRAQTHEGKLYDFVFDFRKADRLVCSEVVYRAYDGLGGVHFSLVKQGGRMCLPAEEMLKQGVNARFFEVIFCEGVDEAGSLEGEAAWKRIEQTI